MRESKNYLVNKLQCFFESIDIALMPLLGYNDTKRGKVIRISNENYYDKDDDDFQNPDFMDGYTCIENKDNKIIIVQKLNLSKISDIIKLTIDETKSEIKDFIKNHLIYFDKKRIAGMNDFRGYYKLNQLIKEDVQTNNDVYFVLELLLDLVESTATEKDDAWQYGIKLGKVKKGIENKEEDEEETENEPSEKELVSANTELNKDEF